MIYRFSAFWLRSSVVSILIIIWWSGSYSGILKIGEIKGNATETSPQYTMKWASHMAEMVKNPPVMQETWVQSLGEEGPLEKERTYHSNILAWRISWTEEPGGLPHPWSHKDSDPTEQLILTSSVQSLSRVWLYVIPWTATHQASLSITNSGACSNSCPSSRWCHPTISPSVVPFSCLQSFSASGSFPMSQFFPSGGQTIGISALASVLPINIQDWFLYWLDLLAVQGTLKSLLQHHGSKASIFLCSAFFMVLLSHPYMTTGKTVALSRWSFVSKVMSLLFNMLSRWVIAFLPRSNHLLISWLQSPSAAILEPPK